MIERTDRPADAPDTPEEELSLRPLFDALWSYRSVMLAAFALIALAYLGLMLVVYARQPKERIGSIGVRLTFEGAENDQFPNGTKFSSTELVSGPVLSEVFRKNELQRYGTFQSFKDSMFVLEANPDLELLSYEYQTKLSDARIGPVDRARLEEEFRKKRDSLKSPIVSVNFRRSETLSQMPEVMMAKILADTLSTWAEQAAQRKGLARYDIGVLSRAVLSPELLTSQGYVIGADVLRSNIQRVLKTIDEIERIPGSRAVRAGTDQIGLADVRARLENLLQFRVEPLLAQIRASGATHTAATEQYFEGRLYESQAALNASEQRVHTLQQALLTYQQKGGRDAGLTPGDNGSGASVTPQLSESFIDKLVDLSRQSNDVKYRQDMTDHIVAEGLTGADLRKEVEYYEAMRKAFTGARGAAGAPESAVRTEMTEVMTEVGKSVEEVQALYKMIAEQNLNPNTVLYSTTSPFIVRTATSLTMRTILLYLLTILLISLIVVPALCLAHYYLRQRTPAKHAVHA